MTGSEAREAIMAMFPLVKVSPEWKRPEFVECGTKKYRGKVRYIAGYSHSRIGSHHMTGRVYERILGYGDTQEAAVEMMRRKLDPARTKESEGTASEGGA